MLNLTDRREQISQFLQPYMEDCFQRSCIAIQVEIEREAEAIWDGLRKSIQECLRNAEIMQRQQGKGTLQYLVFSFLESSAYLDRLELRIDALDDGFYLDEQEAAGYYQPVFLQDRYLEDLNFLYQKTKENFIRLQNYELADIKKEYTSFYQSLLFRMIESMAGLIMEAVKDNGVVDAEHFKILFGGYMDKAVVLLASDHVL